MSRDEDGYKWDGFCVWTPSKNFFPPYQTTIFTMSNTLSTAAEWKAALEAARASVCKSSPVWSFGPKLKDQDQDWSTFILELKKTGLDRWKPVLSVFFGPWTGLLIKILNWFKSIFSGHKLKFWIGRVIDPNYRFKTSPRTLIYVKNWCSYGNILVHLQFSSFFFSAFFGNLRFLQYLRQFSSKYYDFWHILKGI